MRSLSRWSLALVSALAAGCTQLSGVADYERVEETRHPPCSANADCLRLDPLSYCRKDRGYCVALTSPDCPGVTGDYTSDEAFLFASILPTANAEGAPGPGVPLLNAMRLAVDDFSQTVNGLPPRPGASVRRPLVMLECNDGGNLDSAVRAARHAVGEAGVPAILGPMFSGLTVSVATEVAIPGGTFLLSPTASTQSLTDLNDGGLVWRAAPTADVAAKALAAFLPLLEADPAVRERLGLPAAADPGSPAARLRVGVVSKGDAFGVGLATGLRARLSFNGAAATAAENGGDFFEYDYGNPDNPAASPPRYDEVADRLVADAPQVVFLLGVEEINTEILPRLEDRWAAGRPRPFYLAAQGPYTQGLFSFVAGRDASTGIRERILGVVPGSNGPIFRAFRSKYASRYDAKEADTSGPPASYDAVYLLAYGAVAAAAAGAPPGGAGLAAGMARMVRPGPDVSAGISDINLAFNTLAAGQNVNFEGASGPLDFTLETGDTNSDVQIWCVGPTYAGTNSGVQYRADGTLEGSMADVRSPAGCALP
jgi:branched-chain amino acid transport system substrate-binding protein